MKRWNSGIGLSDEEIVAGQMGVPVERVYAWGIPRAKQPKLSLLKITAVGGVAIVLVIAGVVAAIQPNRPEQIRTIGYENPNAD